jgi:hypothetical protein
MQITIEVPDRLGEQLQQLGDRLPEALDRAIQELTSTETAAYQDDRQIVELLASQPSPEVVLSIRPTPALQARMSELLAQNKSATLTRSEEVELVGVASLTRESLFAPRTLGAFSQSSCLQKLADNRMSYIPVALRRLVTERAREQCEYCLFPQTASLFAFEMEHIIAEKHDRTSDRYCRGT